MKNNYLGGSLGYFVALGVTLLATTTISNIFVDVTSVLLIMSLIIVMNIRDTNIEYPRLGILLLLVFMSWVIVSQIIHMIQISSIGIDEFKFTVYILIWTLGIKIPDVLDSKKYLQVVSVVAFVPLLVAEISLLLNMRTIWQFSMFSILPAERYYFVGDLVQRPILTAGLVNPNFTSHLALIGVIASTFGYEKGTITRKLIYSCCLSVLVIALFLTGSRYGVLLLFPLIISYVFYRLQLIEYLRLVSIVIPILAIFLIVLFTGSKQGIISQFAPVRSQIWNFALPAIEKQPIFGYGVEQTSVIIGEFWRSYGPHNTLLFLSLGIGLPGAIFFILLTTHALQQSSLFIDSQVRFGIWSIVFITILRGMFESFTAIGFTFIPLIMIPGICYLLMLNSNNIGPKEAV